MGNAKRQKTDRPGKPGGGSGGQKPPADGNRPRRRRINPKSPVFRFVVTLVVLMCVFNALFYAWISNTAVFDWYLGLNARAAGAIINLTGEDVTVNSEAITTVRFSLGIKRGCDALQASAFFVFLAAASPTATAVRKRLPFILAGTAFLLLMNLVRIVSLYFAGVYGSRRFFDFMHLEFWQAVFIFLPLFMWFMWTIKRLRGSAKRPNDAG